MTSERPVGGCAAAPHCFSPPLVGIPGWKLTASLLAARLSAAPRCTACSNTKMSICQLQQAAQNITQLEARLSGSAASDGASSSSSSSGGGLSGGAVAGIAIGCATVVAAVLSATFFVYHRKVTAQLRQAHLADTYSSGLNLAA